MSADSSYRIADLARHRSTDPLFEGPGEMRALCRALDWSATPLGPSERWPISLRTAVGIVLGSRNPMFLFWGADLVQIYNDAYRPSLGAAGMPASRHPRALGMCGRDFWTDIWDAIGPQIEQVMRHGEATWHVDQYLPILRNDRLEDAWWTYSYGPVYGEHGDVAGVLVVCQETTQRVVAAREREQLLAALRLERSRLAEVFRQAPTFLAVMRGPRHEFQLVNDAYYDLVGRRDLVGRPVIEALPEVREQGFVDLLDRVLRTGEPYVGREVPLRVERAGRGPEWRYADFVYQPLTEPDGSRSGVVAHGHDVTEQVRSRQEVERLLAESEAARAEAEAANLVKAQFLTTMSHELRTPLNAIGGYTELLQLEIAGALSAAQRQYIERIRQSQHHLLGLINEVLNFARLETGSVRYDIEDVAVHAVFATVEGFVAPQAQTRGLELVFAAVDPSLIVRADEEKLRQVLTNLLSNAVKFTPRGGRIDVEALRDNGHVLTVVRDTGIGIAADKLHSIFEPFVQVRSDLTRPYEGTGLGLAISRDLVRGMDGDLTVASTAGAGSTFTVRLPAPPGARP